MIPIYDEKSNMNTNPEIPSTSKVTDNDMNQLREAVLKGVYNDATNEKLLNQTGEEINPKIQRYENLKNNTIISGTAIKCVQGTIVRAVNGNAAALFTFQELNEMFGVSNCNNDNIVALVCNGDGAANGVHFNGATLQDNTVYVTLDAQTSMHIRINYIIFYLG